MRKGKRESNPVLSRRKFLQIVAVAGAAGALYQLGPKFFSGEGAVVRESRTMMGTQINLVVCGPDREACFSAVDATLGRMTEVAGFLSRHSPESELSRLNRSGIINNPSSDLHSVLSLAKSISSDTEGGFDITVLPLLQLYSEDRLPGRQELATTLEMVDYNGVELQNNQIKLAKEGMGITLDGIGKGYVVDQGIAALNQRGFANVYVEAGGDLMVTGTKPRQQPWRIGVRNPRPEHPDSLLTVEITKPTAIATSGDYMQWFTEDMEHHHIIDPRTGRSPLELASATVAAPSVALADGLATAAMVLGPDKAVAMLEARESCEGLLIGKDLRRYKTSGFPG